MWRPRRITAALADSLAEIMNQASDPQTPISVNTALFYLYGIRQLNSSRQHFKQAASCWRRKLSDGVMGKR